MNRPIVLLHGYSAGGLDFDPICEGLVARGVQAIDINIGYYVSLNNEITIKNITEGFDRALRNNPRLNSGQEFDDCSIHWNPGASVLADKLRSRRRRKRSLAKGKTCRRFGAR